MTLQRVTGVNSSVGFGSGYWVGPTAVLTAAHVVVTKGRPAVDIQVVGTEGWTPVGAASVAWHDAGLDVALITVPGHDGPPPAGFGTLVTDGELMVRSRGYPSAEVAVGGAQGSHQIRGLLSPGTQPAHAPGRIGLSVESAPPVDTSKGSPWQGASGSAVTFGPYVVAVLVDDPPAWAPSRLNATRIDRMPEGFWTALAAEGVPATLTSLRAGPDGSAVLADLDDFESGLRDDLRTLALGDLGKMAGAIPVDEPPADTRDYEALAGIVARALTRCFAELLVTVVAHARGIGARIFQRVAPLGWLDHAARDAVSGYLTANGQRRFVVVPSRRPKVVEACLYSAARSYAALPDDWLYVPPVVPATDFVDEAAYREAIEAATFRALNRDPTELATELGLASITAAGAADEYRVRVVLVHLTAPIDDALLRQLRDAFPTFVLVVADESADRPRLDAWRAEGGHPIPFDREPAHAYDQMLRSLSRTG